MELLQRLTSQAFPKVALRRGIRLSESGKPAEAFPLLAVAARAGIADAEYWIGRSYLEGSGVPSSRGEGTRWLRSAANHGSADAQALLAAMCISGLAPAGSDDKSSSARLFAHEMASEPDFAAALGLATKAAEGGSAAGQAILGYILTNGPASMRDADAACRWYERSAAAGSAEGRLGLAFLLAKRGGGADVKARIATLVRAASDAGLMTATYLLAVLTEHGLGVSLNLTAAADLYKMAAEKGLPSAQFRLGLAMIDGRLNEKDPAVGETWIRKAAIGGNIEAAYALGDYYAKNRPPDYIQAAAWFRRAAEAHHPDAARTLASLYFTGSGVAQDAEEGARWLKIAAKSGDRKAQVDLANIVLGQADGVEDPAKIAEWFEAAAASGDLIAALNLGLCFAKGLGVPADDSRAAEWMRRAAEGVPEAQYMYARMLQDGRGVAANPKEARVWFARAATAGVLDARVAVAEMLLNGRGGPRSPRDAVRLFEQAAADNHAGAMFALGALYCSGHDFPVDSTVAKHWFAAAAERGHGQAQLMLALYLLSGQAGEYDPTVARQWLERAAEQGVEEANAKLAELCSSSMPAAAYATAI